MKLLKSAALLTLITLISACSVNPRTGEQEINQTGIGIAVGTVAGGVLGAMLGNHETALAGAALGAALGGGAGYWVQSTSEQLEANLSGSGMTVSRVVEQSTGKESIIVEAPSDIAFATGSSALASGAYQGLTAVATAIIRQPSLRVTIVGHTDDVGTHDKNQALSFARAQSVAMYLYAAGVPFSSVTVKGAGDSAPIADNKTASGRALNRRVAVVIGA